MRRDIWDTRWLALALLLASPSYAQIQYFPAGSNRYEVGVQESSIRFSPPSFDWYVDSVNGADANDGRSAGSALKTITALLAKTITTGQRIGLARGSSWREQLAITADNVTIAAYGSGDRPILDASDVVAAGSWNKTAGRTNVYDVSLAVQTDALASEWPSIWIDGTRLTKAADLATCDATPGTYYYGAVEGTTPITVYVHSTGDSDPRIDGKVYEASIRKTGLSTDGCTGCVVRSVQAQKPYTSYGGILIGRYGRLYDSVSNAGTTHNVFLRGFAEAHDVTATGGYAPGDVPVMYVAYEANPADSPTVLFDRCSATNTVQSTGFFVHTSGASFGTVEYRDATVSLSAGTAFGGTNLTTLVVTRGTVTSPVLLGTNSNATITGTAFTANVAAQTVIAVGTAGTSLTATNLSITAPTNNNVGAVVVTSVANNTITITGTTLSANYAGSRGATFLLRILGANATVTASGNTWGAAVGATAYLTQATTTLASDNNTFKSNVQFSIAGTVYGTLALYQAGTGQDAHSTYSP